MQKKWGPFFECKIQPYIFINYQSYLTLSLHVILLPKIREQ